MCNFRPRGAIKIWFNHQLVFRNSGQILRTYQDSRYSSQNMTPESYNFPTILSAENGHLRPRGLCRLVHYLDKMNHPNTYQIPHSLLPLLCPQPQYKPHPDQNTAHLQGTTQGHKRRLPREHNFYTGLDFHRKRSDTTEDQYTHQGRQKCHHPHPEKSPSTHRNYWDLNKMPDKFRLNDNRLGLQFEFHQ